MGPWGDVSKDIRRLIENSAEIKLAIMARDLGRVMFDNDLG